MGVAAYQRGSRAISAQFCRDRRCPGCVRCSDGAKSEPRPDGWGDEAYQRAFRMARGIVTAYRRYPGLTFDSQAIQGAIQERARVGAATAARALQVALRESH